MSVLDRLRETARQHVPTLGLEAMAAAMPSGHSLRILEMQEAQLAPGGTELSHPFLDTELIEFVASIDASERPISLRNKSMARSAFSAHLPNSVVNRWGKTNADGVNRSVVEHHAVDLTERFPLLPRTVSELVDSHAYASFTELYARGTTPVSPSVWGVWTYASWAQATLRPG